MLLVPQLKDFVDFGALQLMLFNAHFPSLRYGKEPRIFS
jgi:hypothetical protein